MDNRNNNSLFDASDLPAENIITTEQKAKSDYGIEIPVDAIALPSRGLVYPPGHPLHMKETVEFRAMTTREEDILMSQAYIKKGTVVTELIKACLIDKSIHVPSMVAGDRTALMVAIRSSGYTTSYRPTIICPQCKTKNELDIDLGMIPYKKLKIEPVKPHTNLFDFTLPHCKKVVTFQFLTGEMEETIIKEMEAKKKKGIDNTQLVTTRLLNSVVAVGGDMNRGFVNAFCQNIRAADSMALRKYIDDNEPGLDMSYEFTCRNGDCEYGSTISMPIDASFFFPNN